MLIELNEEQIYNIRHALKFCRKESELSHYTTVDISEALNNPIDISDTCPYCGTSEMLCGYNGSGCSHESDEEEE